MTLLRKLLPLVVLTTILLGFGVQPASADLMTLTLNVGNPYVPGSPPSGLTPNYTGPYATVEVNRTSSTQATITFTANAGYLLTAQGIVAVNVNGPFIDPIYPVGSDLQWGGAQQEDGFGSFNYTLDNFDGFAHSVSTVSFVLTGTSGTWASASDVLTANGDGYLAAAHIGVLNDDSSAFLTTGYAAVPDGGTTALLLGLGLAAVGFVSRRKK